MNPSDHAQPNQARSEPTHLLMRSSAHTSLSSLLSNSIETSQGIKPMPLPGLSSVSLCTVTGRTSKSQMNTTESATVARGVLARSDWHTWSTSNDAAVISHGSASELNAALIVLAFARYPDQQVVEQDELVLSILGHHHVQGCAAYGIMSCPQAHTHSNGAR